MQMTLQMITAVQFTPPYYFLLDIVKNTVNIYRNEKLQPVLTANLISENAHHLLAPIAVF